MLFRSRCYTVAFGRRLSAAHAARTGRPAYFPRHPAAQAAHHHRPALCRARLFVEVDSRLAVGAASGSQKRLNSVGRKIEKRDVPECISFSVVRRVRIQPFFSAHSSSCRSISHLSPERLFTTEYNCSRKPRPHRISFTVFVSIARSFRFFPFWKQYSIRRFYLKPDTDILYNIPCRSNNLPQYNTNIHETYNSV